MRKSDKSPNRAVYTVREFQEKTGLSTNAAYAALQRGEVPSIKIGGRILIPKAALDRMLGGEQA